MKKNSIKIFAIILFVLQLLLGFKSFMIVRSVISIEGIKNIAEIDRVLLFVGFLASIFISVGLVILIFISISGCEKESEEDKKTGVKTTKKQSKEKRESEQEKEELKRVVLERLTKDITLINDLEKYTEKVLINISKEYDIMQGIFFVKDKTDKVFRKQGAYAYYSEDELREFTEEVGLSGQVAMNKKLLNISNIPEKYITVLSGLGKSSPANLLIFPILYKDESIGIIELASFKKFDDFAEEILMDFSRIIGEQLSRLNIVEETTS